MRKWRKNGVVAETPKPENPCKSRKNRRRMSIYEIRYRSFSVDCRIFIELIKKLLKFGTDLTHSQLAGFIAGNSFNYIFQCMIGSYWAAIPGDSSNWEWRNNPVCLFIDLCIFKKIAGPVTFHVIVCLLAQRYVCFDDEVTSFQVEIQDFYCKHHLSQLSSPPNRRIM